MEDVRYRPPSTHWIPGVYEGDYLGEAENYLLPDVIEATLESLNPIRTLEKL